MDQNDLIILIGFGLVLAGCAFLISRTWLRLFYTSENRMRARRDASRPDGVPIRVDSLSVRMNAGNADIIRRAQSPPELAEHTAHIAEAREKISALSFFNPDPDSPENVHP